MNNDDYYSDVPVNTYSEDEDDETVPFFKPEAPYHGSNPIIKKVKTNVAFCFL